MTNKKEIFEKWAAKKTNGILRYRTKLFDNDLKDQDKIIEIDGKFLSSEIVEHHESWDKVSDLDRFELILDKMDEGILIIDDIPRIPSSFDSYKRAYYGFDTEDNGLGFPHYYQFASHDCVAISFSFRLLIRWACEKYNLKKNNHIIWGTNIEYELGNICKDFEISSEFADVRWRRGSTAKFSVMYSPLKQKWGNKEIEDDRWFTLWDTMNHWKLSVAKMGATLTELMKEDFSKLPKDFYDFKYAAMDAIISRSYASIQRAEYEKRDIPLKLTPGATALEWYIKGSTQSGENFCDLKIYGTHTDEELSWMMPALKGGRTEVFSLKEWDGNEKSKEVVGYFDINSAYPHCMRTMTFPNITDRKWVDGHKKIMDHIQAGYEGIVECEVDATNVDDLAKKVPYLGCKDEETHRFIFPLGRWKEKYTIFEIRVAMDLGYKFKFKTAIVYPQLDFNPFEKYVAAAYGLRLEGSRTGNSLLRDIGKSLGNNLFGKFGQRSILTKLDDPKNYTKKELENMKMIGNAVLVEEDNGFAPQTNVVWGAYITAGTRHLLYEHIVKSLANGNEILYCDTDSIFIAGGKWPESHPTELGALKHEDDLTYFKALLPKTYVYESGGKRTYKAKGVPFDQRERFFVSGQVEYRKPMKVRESLGRKNFNKVDQDKGIRAGLRSANAWITVTKELKGKYTKRVCHPDGSTSPHILGQN